MVIESCLTYLVGVIFARWKSRHTAVLLRLGPVKDVLVIIRVFLSSRHD